MSAPRRLIEDGVSLDALLGDGADLGQALLRAGLAEELREGAPKGDGAASTEGVEPSIAQREALWARIDLAIAGGALAAAGAEAASSTAAGSTAAGSTAAGSTAAGSTAAGSTAAGSTTAGSVGVGAGASVPLGKLAALKLSLASKVGLAALGATLAGAGAASMWPLDDRAQNASLDAPVAAAEARASETQAAEEAARAGVAHEQGWEPRERDGAIDVEDIPTTTATDTRAAPPDRGVSDTPPRAGARPEAPRTGRMDPAEEAQLVRRARTELSAGDAAAALATLAQLDEIRGGVLGQERAVLRIEALSKSGRQAEAGALAQAFLASHTTSPLAERVRRHVPRPNGP